MSAFRRIVKAISDGIGMAGGVAWPAFGLIFGGLTLTLGSTATILGALSGGVFLFILIPVTYWSYKQNRKEKEALTAELEALKRENPNREIVIPPVSLDTSTKIRTVLLSFLAGFGAIAGTSTGLLGLLTALGVVAGIASIPVVGWVILGIALAFGALCAKSSYDAACEKHQKTQLLEAYKGLAPLSALKEAKIPEGIQHFPSMYNRETQTDTPIVANTNSP